ncbi:hypothetical protein H310_14934 [Aphanomyces invadans]|uniref:Uncharacterized protein n=1 Tax=Aphanomyces invadans TaxID=157072 RepID=A0A024TA50_9STRA|nr:hypothetical protein H310_14934 [Aphanomyces invadans]ETV90232.1 hypothetical protein H310_14934 [Aphanomyces invadans]|eukprot:XP_008881133.1 hypothetical protein H310_14934 [Aphanomyces invadans]
MTFNVDRSTDIRSRKKGHSGRNLKHDSVAQRLKLVPKARRKTFRIFVKYTSTIKPQLTDANQAVRLKWAMDHVHAVTPDDYAFADMMNVVHVDEKWFFASRVSKSYYLAPDEEPPHRTCKSKNFITKVMFLSAIGTWHFTEKVPAARTSKNRPAGTLVTVPVSVTRDVYRAMLIDNVFPAIKAKWPAGDT